MNYSENQTYGRKIVRNTVKSKNVLFKRLLMSWGVCFLIGLLIGCILMGVISLCKKEPVEVYGTIDGKVFTEEPSFDWSSGAEKGFVPLDVPMNEDMQKFIYCLSYGYNIDFPLVMAIIQQESSFRANVISETNDWGLMQINEINHEWLSEELGVTDFSNPQHNIRSGIFILRKLFEEYEDTAKVLMAYHLGETGAARLWASGIYEIDYSNKIMQTAAQYKSFMEGGEVDD